MTGATSDHYLPQPRWLLYDSVQAALACDSLTEFRQFLAAAGYGFAVQGANPVLLPPGGGRRIRLAVLGLNAAFWVRFRAWGEDWAAVGWHNGALVRFWRGLTGDRLDVARKRSIASFSARLGDARVADAMCIAAKRLRHRPLHEQFRYFCGICWKQIRTDAETHPALAPILLPPLQPQRPDASRCGAALAAIVGHDLQTRLA